MEIKTQSQKSNKSISAALKKVDQAISLLDDQEFDDKQETLSMLIKAGNRLESIQEKFQTKN